MKLVHKSLYYSQNAAGAQQTIDLYEDFQLAQSIIIGATLILRGNMVSTAGGAISGFHRDAPCGVIQNVLIEGGYNLTGKRRQIANAPAQELYWPGNYTNAVRHALLRTSAGASATDPFRAVIPMPLRDPRFRHASRTYIDCRDYNSLILGVRNWAADADFATTNLSDLTSVEIEIALDLVENGPPKRAAHFEPSIVYKDVPMVTTSTQDNQAGQVSWDGLATALWLAQYDDSATGDSERVNSILRQFSARQAGDVKVDNTRWEKALRDTWSKYNPSMTTTEEAGIAGLPLSPIWSSRRGPAYLQRDTSTTAPVGITGVTAAANDALRTLVIAAEPVYGAQKLGA